MRLWEKIIFELLFWGCIVTLVWGIHYLVTR